MKLAFIFKTLAALSAAFFIACAPAAAQWQVPNHSVPLGKGVGTGFGFLTCNGFLVGTGAGADPSCRAVATTDLPLGTSVANPGTGVLEAILPIQTVTGSAKTFATADLFKETRRSNSGSAMSDTFPASSATGLVNGTKITIVNVDATASITITPGAGTTISGPVNIVGPGRAIQYVYDLPNTIWRPTLNTGTALLGPNNLSDLLSASSARTNLGLGTAAQANIGTSGTTVPLLSGANTWGATQTMPGLNVTGILQATSFLIPNSGSYQAVDDVGVHKNLLLLNDTAIANTTRLRSGGGAVTIEKSDATAIATFLENGQVRISTAIIVPNSSASGSYQALNSGGTEKNLLLLGDNATAADSTRLRSAGGSVTIEKSDGNAIASFLESGRIGIGTLAPVTGALLDVQTGSINNVVTNPTLSIPVLGFEGLFNKAGISSYVTYTSAATDGASAILGQTINQKASVGAGVQGSLRDDVGYENYGVLGILSANHNGGSGAPGGFFLRNTTGSAFVPNSALYSGHIGVAIGNEATVTGAPANASMGLYIYGTCDSTSAVSGFCPQGATNDNTFVVGANIVNARDEMLRFGSNAGNGRLAPSVIKAYNHDNSVLFDWSNSGTLTITPPNAVALFAQTPAATGTTSAQTATLAKFFDGSAAIPHTANTSSVSISRYEAQNSNVFTGGAGALYVEVIANSTGSGNPNSSAVNAQATQNGVGDVVAVVGQATQNGTGTHASFGGFFSSFATSANGNAFAIQTGVNSSTDNTWSPSTFVGAGTAVSLDNACQGAKRCLTALTVRNGGALYDVGIGIMQQSTLTASIQDDSSSITVLKDTGSHTNGVDLRGGTYSGSPFISTGFSIDAFGAATVTNGINVKGLTSGSATILAHAVAGTPTITLGTSSGTPAVALGSNDTNVGLSLSTATGVLTPSWIGTLANARLATMETNTVKGNATSGTASPTNLAVASCSTSSSALIWTTNTGFGCNTSITAAAVPVGGITGLGTGVATALALNVGSAGAPVTFNGAGGTPSSITLTNASGTAASLTAGNATNTAITDDTTTSATVYPTWVTATTGNLPQKVTSTKLNYNPSTGNLASTLFNLLAVTQNGSNTLNIATGKTLTVNNSVTMNAADGNSITLAGNLAFAGAASLPTIAQGDLWYGSAAGAISALAKDTGTSRFLKNSGTSNNPAWAQPAFSDLSGSVAASQMPALTGDVTTSAGAVATTLATAQPAVHTWALAQTFTVAPVFTDASGSRTALGLGTMATQAASAVAITGGTLGSAVTHNGATYPAIAQGDVLYGSAANTVSALAKNTTATRYLSNAGASNVPAWSQVDLTNGVTGTLAKANGGCGVTGGGTWTPAITFGGASVGVTYGSRTGNYTQCGDVLVVTANVTLSSKGSSTGSMTITGLPVSCGTTIGSANLSYYTSMASITAPVGAATGTSINLYNSGATAASAMTDVNFTNTSAFNITAVCNLN